MRPETKPGKDTCQRLFTLMEEREKQGVHLSPFFLIYLLFCVRIWCLVLWQPFLDHEDRAKSITEKLTQSPDIAEPWNEPWKYSDSFFWWNKQIFISKALTFWLFRFLKPKVSLLTYLYNSYTLLQNASSTKLGTTSSSLWIAVTAILWKFTSLFHEVRAAVMAVLDRYVNRLLLSCCSAISRVMLSSINLRWLSTMHTFQPAGRRKGKKKRGPSFKAATQNCVPH